MSSGVVLVTRWLPRRALPARSSSYTDEPPYGPHAWPSMNLYVLAIVADEKIPVRLDALREINPTTEQQGSRAFVWNIEQAM